MCNLPRKNECIKNEADIEGAKEYILVSNDVKSPTTEGWKGELNTLPSTQRLAILSVAMFMFFGAHNILQEAIMGVPGFKNAVMLGYFEVVGVTVCSYIERSWVLKEVGRAAPLKAYPLLTLCLLSSSALSNMSLNYINFPTKVVFRSCKLLPTMMFATFINRRIFSSLEYICALAICAGLVLFAAADWRLLPTFQPIGLVLVSLSVVADAILPNAQEKLFSEGSSRLEVTLYSNFFTLVAMTCTTFASGDLIGIIQHAMSDRQLALYLAIYVPVAYVAISTFMMIVKEFGAVTGVFIGMARKIMTLLISFLLFPKAFSWCYAFGSALVLGGLFVSSLYKQKKQLGFIFQGIKKRLSEVDLTLLLSSEVKRELEKLDEEDSELEDKEVGLRIEDEEVKYKSIL